MYFFIYFNIYLYASTLRTFAIPIRNKAIHENLSNIDAVVIDIHEEHKL